MRTWSSSAHLVTQISENSLRSSSSSTHFDRLSGSVEAMNRLYSSTVGRQADDVDRRPAEERLVVALARRGDPQLLELVVDQLVDVVDLGLLGERERQALGQDDELRADGVGLEPGHHERLAALAGGDQSVGADRGRDVVVRQEDGQAGDVAVGAVGVAGPDGELLGRALAVEHGLLGIEVDADDRGQLGGVVVGCAGLDPAVQRLVELAAGSNRLPPVCWHGARWPSRAACCPTGRPG